MNVMTLPYGGTPYGLGQQQLDDAKKHGIDLLLSMEHKWGSYMGRLVYTICEKHLKRPMRLLSIFEEAGRKAEKRNKFLRWTVPITNFPVIQHYTEGTTKKVYVQYGPPKGERLSTGYFENTFQMQVCFNEHQRPSKKKQSQGAAPNAIHSLDAAHLMLTCYELDFPVTTIHDSYGCLLGDMPRLYTKVRECFARLYQEEVLENLMKDMGGDASGVELGTLNVNEILDSEYAFA
jgi:DNA-directed RNA polymerase